MNTLYMYIHTNLTSRMLHTRAPEEQLVAKSAELSKQKAAAAKMKELIAQVVNNPDILEKIFKFLDPDSIKSASLVCR